MPCEMFTPWNAKLIPLGRNLWIALRHCKRHFHISFYFLLFAFRSALSPLYPSKYHVFPHVVFELINDPHHSLNDLIRQVVWLHPYLD